jgi:hypothetical protein
VAPISKKDVELNERVHHRASRVVPGLAKLAHGDRLRKLTNPGIYKDLRRHNCGVYVYDCFIMLHRHDTGWLATKGHGFKLATR